MKTRYTWSDFNIKVPVNEGVVIYKNTLTGATISMASKTIAKINDQLNEPINSNISAIKKLIDSNIAMIVPCNFDEYENWRVRFAEYRNNKAHTFILHFLPTIKCQFECNYCFENGSNRMEQIKSDVLIRSQKWLDNYFTSHPKIDEFRFVIFGGEPLLRKDLVFKGLKVFHRIAREHKIKFWCELISNGELLDEQTASMLAVHNWHRVQITLDGPEDVHNLRRHGHGGRPTFANIIQNIQMLLSTDYIQKVDIRISFDMENADQVPELIRYLANFGKQRKISLNLGIIMSTPDKPCVINEQGFAKKALNSWQVAKECGFKIPDEFISGPWCVAIAKHSAVLQPDGFLQKCFCTVGRKEYNFASLDDRPKNYLRDARFEKFGRTDQCVKEKCPFLPICGGGCVHDAIVSNKGISGFDKRFCQKALISELNLGLLKLSYT